MLDPGPPRYVSPFLLGTYYLSHALIKTKKSPFMSHAILSTKGTVFIR